MYCNVYGNAPLLLVRGLGTRDAVFQPLLPALSPTRYQVIVPDLRGHRHSHRLPGPDSVARMAADMRTARHAGLRSCTMLGCATGLSLVQRVAHEYPSRVRGLALV